MASPITSTVAGFFPSQTRRRTPDLPTLMRKEGEERASGGKPVLPTDEEPVAREGAQAALEGVNKHAYFPREASRPTLQKHVSFWDRNKTGVIYPWITYSGCRALSFNPLFSLTYGLAFHLLHTSYWTTNSIFLNPLLHVYIERIHRAKNGSDTGTYDIDGRFHAESFKDIFARYDKNKKGGLTYRELLSMMYGNRNAGDVLGWSFAFFLWSALWLVAADPKTGVLSKRDILLHYDDTLYYEIEHRRKDGKEKLPLWRFGTGLPS